jgi:hypothetical protein
MSEEKDIVVLTETEDEKKGMNIEERDEYSLFTDSHLRSLHDELPEQERKEYKKQGEYMYEKDYENINVDLHSRLVESAAYINEGMKSGLRPSQLDDSEREVMRNIFGKCWYEKYFFTSETD